MKNRITSSSKLIDTSVGTPDEFSFAVLDNNGNNLTTTAPDASDLAELTLGYNGPNSPVQADYETYSLVATSAVPLPWRNGVAVDGGIIWLVGLAELRPSASD